MDPKVSDFLSRLSALCAEFSFGICAGLGWGGVGISLVIRDRFTGREGELLKELRINDDGRIFQGGADITPTAERAPKLLHHDRTSVPQVPTEEGDLL